mgnify:CR=1 FL=1
MRWMAYYSLVNIEIDGFINRYKEKYPDLTVIFTGGDADFLSKRIKNSIFANSNFLLEGLNHILAESHIEVIQKLLDKISR